MVAKRNLPGRTAPYDDLLLDWKRKHDPNFKEPVKKETKAEKKEKRDREKEEKRRADEAAGIFPPAKKKGKKKRDADGNIIPDSAAPGGKKARAGTKDGGDVGALSEEEWDPDMDSDAEMEAMVRGVKASRGVPLALDPGGSWSAGTWFVARNETLRCCSDIMLKALRPGPQNGGAGVGAGGMGGGSGVFDFTAR